MVTTNIQSTEYKDGKRIDIVEHTYTIADDYIRLGQLYYALGQQIQKGENTGNTESLINAQVAFLKGYGDKPCSP